MKRDLRVVSISIMIIQVLLIFPVLVMAITCYNTFFLRLYSVNIVEPFIAIGNTPYMGLIVLYGLLFYTICRKQRKLSVSINKELSYVFLNAFVLILFVFSISALTVMPIAVLENKWSYQCVKNTSLIPVYLYTQRSLLEVFLLTFSLSLAEMVLFLLIWLCFALSGKEVLGVIAYLIIFAANEYAIIKDYSWKWYLPLTNATVAEHYKTIYDGNRFPLWYSYVYYLFLVIILVILIQNIKDKHGEQYETDEN